MTQWVYAFGGGKADGTAAMKELLGGKGANLAEMSKIGIPVPPGFTITTEVCTAYYDTRQEDPPRLRGAGRRRRSRRSRRSSAGKFGDRERPAARLRPLRRAAPSMPGMMDTILNLGLNDATVEGLAAEDRQRALRLRQLPPLHPACMRTSCWASTHDQFEHALEDAEARSRASSSTPT